MLVVTLIFLIALTNLAISVQQKSSVDANFFVRLAERIEREVQEESLNAIAAGLAIEELKAQRPESEIFNKERDIKIGGSIFSFKLVPVSSLFDLASSPVSLLERYQGTLSAKHLSDFRTKLSNQDIEVFSTGHALAHVDNNDGQVLSLSKSFIFRRHEGRLNLHAMSADDAEVFKGAAGYEVKRAPVQSFIVDIVNRQ